MHAVVAEIFPHGAAGERREELHRRRIGRSGGNDDRIIQRALLFQHFDELRHGRALLPDRDVDAVELDLFVVLSVERFLIQDGVENDRGLAGLAVADDQLALPAADRDQGVDGLEAGGHRFVDGLARDNSRRLYVDALALRRGDRALAVDRISERVDHPAEQSLADRHVHDGTGALNRLAFFDLAISAENHDADIIGFEIQRHAAGAVLELHHLAGLHVVETVDARNAIADREHLTDFRDLGLLAEILDLLLENCRNLGGADIHQRASFIANLIAFSLVRSEESTLRLPSVTTRPPMIAGSTVTCRSTFWPPVADFRASLMAPKWASESGSATVTSAVTSPRWRATSARNALNISRIAKERRFDATIRIKLRASPPMPFRSSTLASAFLRSSAPNTGLRTRRRRSGFSASNVSNRPRSRLTASMA